MTVREFIEEDDNANVYIGTYQNYGSNFAYTIEEVQSGSTIEAFCEEDNEDVVLLIQGDQCGVIEE